MADLELVNILKQGSKTWNRWRRQQPAKQIFDLTDSDLSNINLASARLSRVYLNNANLSGAYLVGAHLFGANLTGANLRNADLRFANLHRANLQTADLCATDLRRADIRAANLNNACLLTANICRANLSEANLSAADLRGAKIDGTIFARVDLRTTRGLAEIDHRGPSRVELYTIQLPQDGSALHFLRGAGVPDEWIEDYRARMMHPIQYHSCFISYSNKDDALAQRLHADLQDQGVRCWFAPHDMKIGDKIRPRIDEAIHLQDKLLLLLSKYSVASDWVEHEVETALAREHRDKRTILFPIRLDNAILEHEYTGWAALVQHERHIGDFTRWKDHNRYQVALKRLLRDLKKANA